MASVSSNQPSQYECTVCHENFKTPKILPCAHLLCRHCLVAWLKSHADAKCPLCREDIASEKERDKASCEDIANALPTDLAMEARVECVAILGKEHACGGCGKEAATSVCLDCGDMVCGACAKTHQNLSASRHHKVEELSTMTPERLAFTRQLPCADHTDRTCELYCPTHGAAICHLCVTSGHRACPDVGDLEKKLEEARGVLATLATSLKAGEGKLDQAVLELDRYLSDMEKATQTTLANIEHTCDRLQRSLDSCRQRLSQQAQQPYSDAKRRVEERKASLLKRRGKVTSHWHLVYRVGDWMPPACGVSDMPSRLKQSALDLDFDLDPTLPAEAPWSESRATLTIDDKVLARIESELSQLGQNLMSKTPALPVTTAMRGATEAGPPTAQSQTTGLVAKKEPTVWCFHEQRGQNIVLSNNQQTAERVQGDRDAIVVSSHPMASNTVYEIRLAATKGNTAGVHMVCGVTDGDPATLTLPKGSPGGWKQAVLIAGGLVWEYGTETGNTVGWSLLALRVQNRIGVMVDEENSMHLFVDGQDKGIAACDVRRPCHALFDVSYVYRKINTLPLRTEKTCTKL